MKKIKRLRFMDPVSKKNVTIKIDKKIIENAEDYPVSITYFQEDHAITLHIDANYAVRSVERSIFFDNEKQKSTQVDIKSMNISEAEDIEEEEKIEKEEEPLVSDRDVKYSDERLITSLEEKLKEDDIKDKLNILILGPPRVGKTSLIYRYVYDFFKESYIISEDVKKFKHNVTTLLGNPTDVVLWDIPGQINPEILRDRFKGIINGIICVFDVTRKSTFEELKEKWIPILKEEFKSIDVIFLANKIDLANRRDVYMETIELVSKEHDILVFETSVRSNLNVGEALDELIMSTYLRSK